MRRGEHPFLWWIEFAGIRFIYAVSLILGRHGAFFLGWCLGTLFYLFGFHRKRRTLQNISMVYGDSITRQQKRRIARNCYAYMGGFWLELFSIARRKPKRLPDIVEIRGEENLRRALERGKGVILFSGHIGNFPLLGIFLVKAGYPLTTFLAPAKNPRGEELLTRIRKRLELPFIYAVSGREAVVSSLRILRSNGILWTLIDQKFHRGIVVDFLGHPAQTSPIVALLAARSDASLLPATIHRLPNSKHIIEIGEEVRTVKTDDKEEMIRVNMEHLNRIIGERLLLYPEQWIWFHNRWQIRWHKVRS